MYSFYIAFENNFFNEKFDFTNSLMKNIKVSY